MFRSVSDEDRFRDAAEALVAEVERAEGRKMRGSELGVIYQRRFPELRDLMSLGKLLDEHADRLTVVERDHSRTWIPPLRHKLGEKPWTS
jgi:ABC-type glutathione transport system ATPase component